MEWNGFIWLRKGAPTPAQVTGCCEYGNEPSGSIISEKFLDNCTGFPRLNLLLGVVGNKIRTFRWRYALSKRPNTYSPLKQPHIPEQANPHHYSVTALSKLTSECTVMSPFHLLLNTSRVIFTIFRVEIHTSLTTCHLRRCSELLEHVRHPGTITPLQNRTMSLPNM